MCFLKRVLPFTLALMIGFGTWALIERFNPLTPSATRMIVREMRTPVVINYVPELRLTPAAMKSSEVNGSIRLNALLGADGKVLEVKPAPMLPYGVTEESLQPLERAQAMPARIDGKPALSLPYGLTESAIETAKQMEFTPATIDGTPAYVWVSINASFNYGYSPDCVGCSGNEFTVMEDGVLRWRAETNY